MDETGDLRCEDVIIWQIASESMNLDRVLGVTLPATLGTSSTEAIQRIVTSFVSASWGTGGLNTTYIWSAIGPSELQGCLWMQGWSIHPSCWCPQTWRGPTSGSFYLASWPQNFSHTCKWEQCQIWHQGNCGYLFSVSCQINLLLPLECM